VLNTLIHHDFGKIKRADTFQASHVDPELMGIGSALVMGIDSANGTKIVLRGFCVELIEAQKVFSLQEPNAIQLSRNSHGSPHSAIGTVTPAYGVEPIGELNLKSNRFAVTSSAVLFLRCAQSMPSFEPIWSEASRMSDWPSIETIGNVLRSTAH
jgi:hypothetical protein